MEKKETSVLINKLSIEQISFLINISISYIDFHLNFAFYSVMSVDDNDFLAMGALKNGAFLSIKKPVTVDMLHCLWQHVLRERMKLYRKMEIIMGMDAANHHIVNGLADERNNMQNNNFTGKKNICGRNSLDKEFESENQIINNIVKRKVCTEWTQDLHVKFMDAVVQLGEGSISLFP